MQKINTLLSYILLIIFIFTPKTALAKNINIAVASNFTNVIKHIAGIYEKTSGHKITLIFGSTGKHYAQIKNGAPFDIFFAADTKRPRLLEQEGFVIDNSRFTYAIGKLVLWSPKIDNVKNKILHNKKLSKLSIANPKLSPYGRAAMETLQKLGIWNNIKKRLVMGENISQAFWFVNSENAELGFISISQLKQKDIKNKNHFWQVPEKFYTPIKQQAVLLTNNKVAKDFLLFIKSTKVKKIINNFGYKTL